jgi:ABC-type nickel/cobalt efflux system permease component RcnA
VTWRTLLGLGISGGLVPCPSALVVLLAAVSFGRTGFGLILVIVFSLGLAAVLTTVGLLFVKGGRMMQGVPGVWTLGRYIPAASALVILMIGVAITVGAVSRIVV